MKDLPFLTHDIGARNDPKLMDLQMEMGGQGLAIFWCLVEMLWENGGFIPANYKSIAFALRWCKPAEVEKVVKGFGLFEVVDGNITSRSACERIRVKREKAEALSEVRREAGRSGGLARSRSLAKQNEANAKQTDSKCQANSKQNEAYINLSINKSINNNINNNTPPTADDFFEYFFFRNLKNPAQEAERFVKHYSDRGWTYQDGSTITDFEKAAADWKPAKPGENFSKEALGWYKAVWLAAKERVPNAQSAFLASLQVLTLRNDSLTIRYKTREDAAIVSQFILDNDLAGDWKIDFRFSN